ARTSSTAAATRRWEASGATSTSLRSAAKKFGKTRPRVIPKPSRTNGGTGTTTTAPKLHPTRSGSTSSPTLKEQPPEGATKRRKLAREGVEGEKGNSVRRSGRVRAAVRHARQACGDSATEVTALFCRSSDLTISQL